MPRSRRTYEDNRVTWVNSDTAMANAISGPGSTIASGMVDQKSTNFALVLGEGNSLT